MTPARLGVLAAVAVTMTACAANRVGVEGYGNFERSARLEIIGSERSYEDFARCFERNAKLLPFSSVQYFPEGREASYSLSGYGWWFETITFKPTETGSRADIRLAHNYDQKWMDGFMADRYPALLSCAKAGGR